MRSLCKHHFHPLLILPPSITANNTRIRGCFTQRYCETAFFFLRVWMARYIAYVLSPSWLTLMESSKRTTTTTTTTTRRRFGARPLIRRATRNNKHSRNRSIDRSSARSLARAFCALNLDESNRQIFLAVNKTSGECDSLACHE